VINADRVPAFVFIRVAFSSIEHEKSVCQIDKIWPQSQYNGVVSKREGWISTARRPRMSALPH
jgi:hypothetical protein